jgi:iron-sulfur cluster repair protein YtfE (RIC family)
MTPTLTHSAPVAQQHHERLRQHVDRMPATADLLDGGSVEELRTQLDAMCDFMTGLLVPHMDAAERALYPELERMMQNRHSMTPTRREHAQIRAGIDQLIALRDRVRPPRLSLNDQVALRRTIFQLYGLLKVHLAEEMLYADIVEKGASVEAEEALATAMEHSGAAHSG